MKDTIDMAREVKATAYTNRHYPDRTTYTFGPEKLEAFANLVRADEREACAKVCEKAIASIWEYSPEDVKQTGTNVCNNLAAAIRARGETK